MQGGEGGKGEYRGRERKGEERGGKGRGVKGTSTCIFKISLEKPMI